VVWKKRDAGSELISLSVIWPLLSGSVSVVVKAMEKMSPTSADIVPLRIPTVTELVKFAAGPASSVPEN
jgi:hypothetical protein